MKYSQDPKWQPCYFSLKGVIVVDWHKKLWATYIPSRNAKLYHIKDELQEKSTSLILYTITSVVPDVFLVFRISLGVHTFKIFYFKHDVWVWLFCLDWSFLCSCALIWRAKRITCGSLRQIQQGDSECKLHSAVRPLKTACDLSLTISIWSHSCMGKIPHSLFNN